MEVSIDLRTMACVIKVCCVRHLGFFKGHASDKRASRKERMERQREKRGSEKRGVNRTAPEQPCISKGYSHMYVEPLGSISPVVPLYTLSRVYYHLYEATVSENSPWIIMYSSQKPKSKADIPLKTGNEINTNSMKCTWPTQTFWFGCPTQPIFHWLMLGKFYVSRWG